MRCPECTARLEADTAYARPVERCCVCDGIFVAQIALQQLLQEHKGARGDVTYRRPSPSVEEIRYRKCPTCEEPMLRRNFLETSGVIVDVCGPHGVWLGRGKLEILIVFARSGALEEAERRLLARQKAIRDLVVWGDYLFALGPGELGGGLS